MNKTKKEKKVHLNKKEKKPPSRKKNPFHIIALFFVGIFKGIHYLIVSIKTGIQLISKSVVDKLRFSLRLRLTLTYALSTAMTLTLFIIFFLILASRLIPPEISAQYSAVTVKILMIGLLLGLIISIFEGSRAGKKLVEPIYKMNESVKEISIQNLSKRIEVSGVKDELKDLAVTFNSMMDRIQSSVEKQNQFVSDASHELRTPISVVKGYADLLARWGMEDQQVREEALEAIRQESDHMKQLIEQLLFLARGDRNAQKTEIEEVPIREIMEEIYRETKLIDETHEIYLEENEDNIILADRGMIKEAVRIFVENSMKYTPPGGKIFLSTYQHNGSVEIIIRDTGEGIRQEELRKIFDRFYRADKSRNKQSGGTGLGLAIAKWIVDMHQGKIFAKSKLGEGTEFCIRLPLAANYPVSNSQTKSSKD